MTDLPRTYLESQLSDWWGIHGRDLPWNETDDPYAIWISEIILQQTRVETGLKYYQDFLAKWPTMRHLAEATEDEVLRAWQGLGYYSRARNLHRSAKILVSDHQAQLPRSSSELQKLPGIGPYTSAAIASFAYGEKSIALDGNIHRVLSRVFYVAIDLTKSKERRALEKLGRDLIHQDSALWNRSLMEIGSSICQPRSTDCEICPLSSICQAFAKKDTLKYPIKKKRITVRERYLDFLLVRDNECLLIEKRGSEGIWKSLYQLPLIEQEKPETEPKATSSWNDIGDTLSIQLLHQEIRQLTHQSLRIRIYGTEMLTGPLKSSSYIIHPIESLDQLAFPISLRQFLELQGLI